MFFFNVELNNNNDGDGNNNDNYNSNNQRPDVESTLLMPKKKKKHSQMSLIFKILKALNTLKTSKIPFNIN